jgi:hypothetical protein
MSVGISSATEFVIKQAETPADIARVRELFQEYAKALGLQSVFSGLR